VCCENVRLRFSSSWAVTENEKPILPSGALFYVRGTNEKGRNEFGNGGKVVWTNDNDNEQLGENRRYCVDGVKCARDQ
jgi:hypothetical protein